MVFNTSHGKNLFSRLNVPATIAILLETFCKCEFHVKHSSKIVPKKLNSFTLSIFEPFMYKFGTNLEILADDGGKSSF